MKSDGEQNDDELVGIKKAATFLLALDSSAAASVMRNMTERELSLISEEMTRLGEVSPKDINQVLAEYDQEQEHLNIEPMLEEMLKLALGEDKARELMERIKRRTRDREPFRALRKLNIAQLEGVLKGEHPRF